MKKSKKVLIIGGGFAGCATAYTLNELNHLSAIRSCGIIICFEEPTV